MWSSLNQARSWKQSPKLNFSRKFSFLKEHDVHSLCISKKKSEFRLQTLSRRNCNFQFFELSTQWEFIKLEDFLGERILLRSIELGSNWKFQKVLRGSNWVEGLMETSRRFGEPKSFVSLINETFYRFRRYANVFEKHLRYEKFFWNLSGAQLNYRHVPKQRSSIKLLFFKSRAQPTQLECEKSKSRKKFVEWAFDIGSALPLDKL